MTNKMKCIKSLNVTNVNETKPKRGRKSKKELALKQQEKDNVICVLDDNNVDNNVDIDDNNLDNNNLDNNNLDNNNLDNNIVYDNNLVDIDNVLEDCEENICEGNIILNSSNISSENNQKLVCKKRGRKPKGGKIIQQISILNNNKEIRPNVILHLKCSLKELQTNAFNSSVESFHFTTNKNEFNYEVINENKKNAFNQAPENNTTVSINDDEYLCDYEYDDSQSNKDLEIKDVWKKLKTLENNLHINNISDKKSACFWCTFEFDNPPVYIPKYYIKKSYNVYGCFCSPECAVAHLMEENIDSSSKFERYYLLNNIYSKIYNYNKNIKPAPNPFYMLDKYYGNLTIQEYRALLRNERLFLIVDKPLTRILPELHEDNDDFIINNKIIPSNKYQIKKKNQRKTQNKNNILSEKFGVN